MKHLVIYPGRFQPMLRHHVDVYDSLKRKNINAVLTIELIFIILASFIIFTSQPLNWIVALIMFTHLFGVGWLISNPDSYYTMVNTNSTDMDSLETASAMIVFGYGVFVYSSQLFLS